MVVVGSGSMWCACVCVSVRYGFSSLAERDEKMGESAFAEINHTVLILMPLMLCLISNVSRHRAN